MRQDTHGAADEAVSLLSYDLLTSGQSITGIANIALNHAKMYTGSTLGYASVIDPATRNNICHTLTGMIGHSCRIDSGFKGIVFPIDENGSYPALWGHSLNTRQAFYTNSPRDHEASVGLPDDHDPVASFLSAPAISGNQLKGQISLANAPGGYTEKQLDVVSRMAKVFAFALDRLQLRTEAPRSEPQSTPNEEVSGLIATLLEERESLRKELRERMASNVRTLATPFFEKLSHSHLDPEQAECLRQLRSSLEEATSPFTTRTRLLDLAFTPQELQVAMLVKSGLQTKDIANQLGISINAVNFHRKNIRRKLSISNKRVNLSTYLLSLEQW